MKAEVAKLVTFRLGADAFAAEVASVDRVLRYAAPKSVPDLPEWIEGVIEHRAKVIPIVDMRARIGLPQVEPTPTTRILVLNTSEGFIGAIVDVVAEVASVPRTNVTPPPPLFRGLAAHFVRGIAKIGEQLVVILDVDRVLTSDDRIAFERAIESAEAALRE
jgi:purine-binding chemotaxis protein CheW